VETTIEVIEQSQVGQARRFVAELGRTHGMSELDLGRAALIATETATNLVKYGKHGSITLSSFFDEGAVGIQFITVDHGPGFADFGLASRDGHSTGGSLGFGLGIIMRASDLFDVYTVPEQGSAFLSRVSRERMKPKTVNERVFVGSRRVAKRGQDACGDAWGHVTSGRWERIGVVDGRGHGPLAATASAEAISVLRAAGESDTPADIVARCHEALKGTRGAVMGVAAIDVDAGVLQFAGVGNIDATLYAAAESFPLTSTEGIVGYRMAKTSRIVERKWLPGSTLVMNSDGLSNRWHLTRYPGLLQRHPELIASVLFRDFARDTDDATIVVAKDLR
jgi:anti-sigma regulatory factor (Ser/Thr protein kinase)